MKKKALLSRNSLILKFLQRGSSSQDVLCKIQDHTIVETLKVLESSGPCVLSLNKSAAQRISNESSHSYWGSFWSLYRGLEAPWRSTSIELQTSRAALFQIFRTRTTYSQRSLAFCGAHGSACAFQRETRGIPVRFRSFRRELLPSLRIRTLFALPFVDSYRSRGARQEILPSG